ncbi:response regulator transcription factor [Nocardioides aestuarii]|uniref:Response regulator n=1 Tax=Nocardioides aestuarii TaxID=252231 RepID=A0ABW4THG9_9ACTN
MPTRVLLVDDHAVLAESLSLLLGSQSDLEVVGTARTLADARRLVETSRPDVVLLDVALPDGDGIAEIPALLERHPGARVVVLTGTTSDRVLVGAVEAGAAGFLSKSGGVRRVVDTVRAAAADEAVLPEATLERLRPLMRQRADERHVRLTEREVEVLQLVAEGLTNAAIAERLVVSLHTVRNHVARISRKLGAHSKLEALSIALRQGLVTP